MKSKNLSLVRKSWRFKPYPSFFHFHSCTHTHTYTYKHINEFQKSNLCAEIEMFQAVPIILSFMHPHTHIHIQTYKWKNLTFVRKSRRFKPYTSFFHSCTHTHTHTHTNIWMKKSNLRAEIETFQALPTVGHICAYNCMYVLICVCMCIDMCLYVYWCVYMCIDMCLCMYWYVFICVCTSYVLLNPHMCLQLHVCVNMCLYVYWYVFICILMCLYVYWYVFMYVFICVRTSYVLLNPFIGYAGNFPSHRYIWHFSTLHV